MATVINHLKTYSYVYYLCHLDADCHGNHQPYPRSLILFSHYIYLRVWHDKRCHTLYFFSSRVTFSTWCVWGNMSTGWISMTRYFSSSRAMSRAWVAGLQLT